MIPESEADFQSWVMDTAQALGWRRYHARKTVTRRKDGSLVHHTPYSGDGGFVDLVLAHPQHGIIFAELKAARGRVTAEQQAWLDVLHGEVWRPKDRELIERRLRGNS